MPPSNRYDVNFSHTVSALGRWAMQFFFLVQWLQDRSFYTSWKEWG
jgi:hypothetical protein